MKRLKTDVMGVSEMRWPGTEGFRMDDYTACYSGEIFRVGTFINIVNKKVYNGLVKTSKILFKSHIFVLECKC